MKRILIPLALLVLGTLAGYGLLHRPARHAPADLEPQPFSVAPAGAGSSIQYQPGDIPIRTLAWSRPLAGGAVVAQVLSQSSRQQVFLFQNGQPGPGLSLVRPAQVSGTAFDFAVLQDAALVPGKVLLLLYRLQAEDHPALLIAWNLAEGRQAWAYQGDGTRLALAPEGTRVFLFGGAVPIQCLSLDPGGLRGTTAPEAARVELPPGTSAPADVLPTGGEDILAAFDGALGACHAGTWTQRPAPAPSPLGFPAGQGRLAEAQHRFWWQPEPGRLQEVGKDGSLLAETDLASLTASPHAQDGQLLRLLGADAGGALWFAPVAPTFRPAPPPDAGLPGDVPQLPPTSEPSVPAAAPAGPAPAEAWAPYLQAGLARLYCWTPGSSTARCCDWTVLWPRLQAPADLPRPEGDGGLVPAAGGFLLGGQERRWWLPLTALAPDQPR